MTTYIRDAKGTIIGRIEEVSTGELVIKDIRMNIVGRYDPKSDRTVNAGMQTVGYGNQLVTLLPRK
jgi:hypothetical protein